MFSLFPFSSVIKCKLIKRYKRFLADVELKNKTQLTVHCPNSGAMLTVKNPGTEIWLTPITSSTAKLKYRWQCANVDFGNGLTPVGVDTHLPNKLVEFYLSKGEIPIFKKYDSIKREVRYDENSRVDFLLSNKYERLFLEVKNVHLMRNSDIAEFPDSVTARGAKHMYALARQVGHKVRACVVYIIQRKDVHQFKIADDIDLEYAKAAQYAKEHGVEFFAFNCHISEAGIQFNKEVEICN